MSKDSQLFDNIYILLTEFNPMSSVESRKAYSEKIRDLLLP
jgi:hypothetical protein